MNGLIVNTGAISMVPSGSMAASLNKNRQRYPHLPEPGQIIADLRQLNSQQGVPAVVMAGKGGEKPKLLLYTSSYTVGIYPSNKGDGYGIGYVNPLNLHDHERLTRGVLWLKAKSWGLYGSLGDIPKLGSNHMNMISAAWAQLEQLKQHARIAANLGELPLDTLTPEHETYLNTISTLIDVARKLEQDKNKLTKSIAYRRVEAAAEERYAARGIYIFYTVGNPQVSEKETLRIQEAPDLYGRVFAINGNKLTIKFDGSVDRTRIPEQGNFERMMSDTIFRTQQRAVDTLRAGESKNKSLLRVLVNQAYQHYLPDRAVPQESLNREQEEAFQRALTVPDMLLVLGPPGTGKTRSITEIVRQCGERRQRVLIASRTHKAVDNVLERLSGQLTVVRFGMEERVSENVRPKLIDVQARALQGSILQRTESVAQRLSQFLTYKEAINRYLAQITESIQQLSQSEANLQVAEQKRLVLAQQIELPLKSQIDQAENARQKQQETIERHNRSLVNWTQRRATNEAKTQITLFGFLFSWLVAFCQRRMESAQNRLQAAQQLFMTVIQAYNQVQLQRQQLLQADPTYQQIAYEIGRIQIENSRLQQKALNFAQPLNATLLGMATSHAPLEHVNTDTLRNYVVWYREQQALAERKATLLQEWRTELESRTEQLYPELLHYADVVGATCIGVATAKGLDDIEFDLAIIDEAGQICLTDLLVPLVRARRAVLVGDHHQLPPFVDSEVQTWLDSLSAKEQQALGLEDEEADKQWVSNLLTRSMFEQLFTDRANLEHIVRFKQQHRTPQVIADFVSQHFYEGQLTTFGANKLENAPHTDSLFSRPLVFIDTSSLPAAQRAESVPGQQNDGSDPEGLGKAGYFNKVEADLLAAIAAYYQQEEQDWVIIVPYLAQATRIRSALRQKVEVQNFNIDERIATIDSFQGGERDIVLYSFTRSNARGNIGFLKELRRLNVAMTRAKQQLVLVGDLLTLSRARDPDFRRLLESLGDYARQRGEFLDYNECRRRLSSKVKG